MTVRHAAGTGSSILVDRCQSCGAAELESVFFAGYLPPVNTMPAIGTRPVEQPSYPAQMLRCPRCELVQLGLIVDPAILFPPDYPYTSGTTRILREDFADLGEECRRLFGLTADDLVVDIGSNDGTLLSNFAGRQRVLGIEPTDAGKLAIAAGIPTRIEFFDEAVATGVRREHGPARLVTAANVFAHMEDVHSVVEAILTLLADDGVFVSESHHLLSLVEGLQYDTIYHEHLRYYSLRSLRTLLAPHGLEVFRVKRIPTHGGSIRVYAARAGQRRVDSGVEELAALEAARLSPEAFARFRRDVVGSKLGLYALLEGVRRDGARVYAIGAPSRASTLVSYVGLDEGIVDCVLEIQGSRKIGRYMPKTLIPVLDEKKLFEDQPEYALLLSWHIADELIDRMRTRGFRGDFIVPLPIARILRTSTAVRAERA